MKKERPIGISLCGAIFISVGGLFSLMGFLTLISPEGLMKNKLNSVFEFLIMGILTIIVGFGLWRLKPWSRIAANIVLLFGIYSWFSFFSNLMYTKGHIEQIIEGSFFSSIPNIVLLVYLNRPKVKEQFK